MTQPSDLVQTPRSTSSDYATWLIIAVSTSVMCARLATVEARGGGTPLLSANDRSRWSTIRALVDEGTYALDRVIFRANSKRDPNWYSIDLVKHRGPDGRQHYYSSKPTLLTTLLAGPYWLLNRVSGVSLVKQTFYVVRVTLLLLHVLPLVLFLILLVRICDQYVVHESTKLFVVTSAAFATPLTTFAVTLNNHLPAAVFVLVSTWAVIQIWRNSAPGIGLYVLAGFSAAMTTACELPGLSFLAVAGAILLLKSIRQTMIGFVPPALIVAAGVFGTNYLAHGTWSTAYANRNDGAILATLADIDAPLIQPGVVSPDFRDRLSKAGIPVPATATIAERPLNRGSMLWNPDEERQYALRLVDSRLEVREWNNWYEYPNSYWSSGNKQGVDRGESSKAVYAFHTLIGHHGIFSLTPIWLLSVAGMAIWLVRGDLLLRGLAGVSILLTGVCLAFFILLRPVEDMNYGGVSCCFRWTIWLIPFWLLHLIPAMDATARWPWLQRLAIALLVVSVFSALYNSRNPWSHPWLFDYWTHLGWIKY